MKILSPISYLKGILLFLFSCAIFFSSTGQVQKFNSKLSPSFAHKINSIHPPDRNLIRIMVKGQLPIPLTLPKYNAIKITEYDSVSFYMISATIEELKETVLRLSTVLFVEDGGRVPKEEVQVNNLDLGTNKINVTHTMYPDWNGEGMTVSVKEDRPDTADIDFAGRYLSTILSSPIFSSHASNMATMIAGAGNSWYLGKGPAWAAIISSSNFANLLPDHAAVLQQYNISVQNHSYGVAIENFYGADAVVYDASIISNPTLLHVFSSGNSGLLSSSTGSYIGIPGFANLTGSFKMAKNILTAGATDSFGNVVVQSSKGPAHDGRVKPELVGFGIEGSSGAAALVSGVSLMLQQQYKQLNGSIPSNALVKAVLLNSADDKGNKEVDYSNGFGSLNALNAIKTVETGRFMDGNVSHSGEQRFSITIPSGIKKIKITIVWNDPPAQANAVKALINDLDMELKNNTTNEIFMPWVLNNFPHVDSLNKLAVRKRDSLNNVEQITLDNPIAGIYDIIIKGFAITTVSQNFYIAYQFDSTDIFEWHFPTSPDPVFSSAVNTLRWNSSYLLSIGKLNYSIDNGNTWQLIEPAVELATGHYNWIAPAAISVAKLKMTIGTVEFMSDTFVISTRTPIGVGFNCPDSFQYYWNKLPTVNTYRLYRLGSRYMEPILMSNDSFAVLQKRTNASLHYAVAPVINGKEGVKSYTLNYTLQGVDCYIRSFLSSLINNNAELELFLGSLNNINKIILEKWDGTKFIAVQQLVNYTSLHINFRDNNLSQGLNIYRIKLELAGGGIVYSLEEMVFYFNDTRYIIFPNPAAQYQDINIAQENVDIAMMQVFNTTGVKVFEMDLDNRINKIPAGKLSKGFYFIRIIYNGKSQETLRLIVY